MSAASLVALKSQLAKKQQEVESGSSLKDERSRGKSHPRGSVAAVLERSNAGVAERDKLDRLELKVRETLATIFTHIIARFWSLLGLEYDLLYRLGRHTRFLFVLSLLFLSDFITFFLLSPPHHILFFCADYK